MTDRTDTLPPLPHPERYYEWTAAEALAIDAWGRRLLAERDERIRVLTEALQECVKSQEWYRRELDRLDAESGEDGPPNEQDKAEINARKLLENRNG